MSNWARIAYMDRCLNEKYKECFTVKEIAEKFEVSGRQVKKDIEYMRYQLEAPIFYSKRDKKYIYGVPFQLLSIANHQLLLSCSFIRSILEVSNYLPIVKGNMLKKLDEFLGSEFVELSKNIVYQLNRFELIDTDALILLIDSMTSKRQVEIEYNNIEGEDRVFAVEPSLLLNYSGEWYMIAYNHRPESLGVFKVSRINKVTTLGKPYEYYASKDELDELIGSSFGAFKDSDNQEIKKVAIRFYDYAYRLTKNMVFHPDQRKKTGRNKRGNYREFRIPVKGYPEILGHVLQYGSSCEVLSPDDFRQLWLNEIRKLAKLYL